MGGVLLFDVDLQTECCPGEAGVARTLWLDG